MNKTRLAESIKTTGKTFSSQIEASILVNFTRRMALQLESFPRRRAVVFLGGCGSYSSLRTAVPQALPHKSVTCNKTALSSCRTKASSRMSKGLQDGCWALEVQLNRELFCFGELEALATNYVGKGTNSPKHPSVGIVLNTFILSCKQCLQRK